MKKIRKDYFTDDELIEMAREYNSPKELKQSDTSLESLLYKRGLYDKCDWIKRKKYVPDGYWDIFENVQKAASECLTKKEFHIKYSRAYKKAKDYGWLEKLHFEDGNKINAEKRRIWTYEKCYEIAHQYKYKSDFEREQPSAYQTARKNGWLETYDWFDVKPDPYNTNMHLIYAYEFKETNSVYIGLTINLKKRDYQHRNLKNSSVLRHSIEYGLAVPQPKVLEQDISRENSGEKEHYYVEQYRSDGWNILNRAKTGKTSSSKGSIEKYSQNEIINTARNYSTMKEFYTAEPVMYQVMNKKGMELDWLVKVKQANGYWDDKERCRQAAMQCSTPREFTLRFSGAYESSRKNKWMREFFPNKRRDWDYESCKKAAAECKHRSEFERKYSQGYKLSKTNGWLDDFFPKAA